MSMSTDSDERVAALAWAAAFRRRRTGLRADMASGERSLEDVLAAADDSDVGLIRLLFVLESLPGAGKVATRRHLARLSLAERLPIRELTGPQRALLLSEFPLAGSSEPNATGAVS